MDDIFKMFEPAPELTELESAQAALWEMRMEYAYSCGQRDAWREQALRATGIWPGAEEHAESEDE